MGDIGTRGSMGDVRIEAGDDKQANMGPGKIRYERTQEMDDEGATGKNTAYGNTAGNTGVAVRQEQE